MVIGSLVPHLHTHEPRDTRELWVSSSLGLDNDCQHDFSLNVRRYIVGSTVRAATLSFTVYSAL